MHYYQFNIGDYRRDTSHLIPIEHYIYRTLIDWYYLDELPIPKETQVVSRRLGLGNEWIPNINNVLSDFFDLGENGWVHKRIEEEIFEYRSMCEKNKLNSKLGGRPKKTQSVSTRIPNQEPITKEPIKDIQPLAMLMSMDVDKNIAQDWLKIRKGKKLPLTKTALDQIIIEANKAGLTLNEAIKKSCQESWGGFKASWLTIEQGSKPKELVF